jgi:hypothetical protein
MYSAHLFCVRWQRVISHKFSDFFFSFSLQFAPPLPQQDRYPARHHRAAPRQDPRGHHGVRALHGHQEVEGRPRGLRVLQVGGAQNSRSKTAPPELCLTIPACMTLSVCSLDFFYQPFGTALGIQSSSFVFLRRPRIFRPPSHFSPSPTHSPHPLSCFCHFGRTFVLVKKMSRSSSLPLSLPPIQALFLTGRPGS